MAAPAQNSEGTAPRELLTDDERTRLAQVGGRALVSWGRRVRLEEEALDQLLSGEPEPPTIVPFGRRSSAAWDG